MPNLKWHHFYLLSFLPGVIAWAIYIPFDIILPIFGNFWTQLLWFLIFIVLTLRSIWSSQLIAKFFEKAILIFAIFISVGLTQFINLSGALFKNYSFPEELSICEDISFTTKTLAFSGDKIVYRSSAPWLYYDNLEAINQGNIWFHSDEAVLLREDVIRDDEFDTFRDCFGFGRNRALICPNSY